MEYPGPSSALLDPELEELLAEAPVNAQYSLRGTIVRLQPIMSPEEWVDIRSAFIGDLIIMREKKRLDQECGEIDEVMEAAEDTMAMLSLRREAIVKSMEWETDPARLRKLEEDAQNLSELEAQGEKIRQLKQKLDALRNR
jgi:hypothetical protein